MQRSTEILPPVERSIPYREAYTYGEVAELLGGGSERWVRGLAYVGDLPVIRIGGRVLIARADLLAFIEGLRADEQKARAAVTRHEFGATA